MTKTSKKRKKKKSKRQKGSVRYTREVAREGRILDSSQRRGILIRHALTMENLGPHPGQALLRIGGSMYDPQVKVYHRLPGKSLAVLITSEQDVEEVFDVIERALHQWAESK